MDFFQGAICCDNCHTPAVSPLRQDGIECSRREAGVILGTKIIQEEDLRPCELIENAELCLARSIERAAQSHHKGRCRHPYEILGFISVSNDLSIHGYLLGYCGLVCWPQVLNGNGRPQVGLAGASISTEAEAIFVPIDTISIYAV